VEKKNTHRDKIADRARSGRNHVPANEESNPKRLKILLTNDDGYDAPGLAALCQAFAAAGEITLVAPLFEQSCTGHGITVHTPLRLKQVHMPGTHAAWALQGMPADCVKLALEHCFEHKPDLIVSGVNSGPNLGSDVLYSGTVSGALEGYINNIPAIAVSVDAGGEFNFSVAAAFALKTALWWQKEGFKPFCALNINIPAIPGENIRGVKICPLGRRSYRDIYQERHDPRGRRYFWLGGTPCNEEDENTDTDIEALAAAFITVTPLHIDLTAYDILEKWRQREFKFKI
jgi:5'-nucleotidase